MDRGRPVAICTCRHAAVRADRLREANVHVRHLIAIAVNRLNVHEWQARSAASPRTNTIPVIARYSSR